MNIIIAKSFQEASNLVLKGDVQIAVKGTWNGADTYFYCASEEIADQIMRELGARDKIRDTENVWTVFVERLNPEEAKQKLDKVFSSSSA